MASLFSAQCIAFSCGALIGMGYQARRPPPSLRRAARLGGGRIVYPGGDPQHEGEAPKLQLKAARAPHESPSQVQHRGSEIRAAQL